jgi:hypothetical protein
VQNWRKEIKDAPMGFHTNILGYII